MATRPKKIVLVSDGAKKFGAEAFEVIRTVLAAQVGGNVNLGVKLAAEAFAPRMPASVTVDELKSTIPAIAAKFVAESAKKPANNDGKLPLNDEAQKSWDSGRWRGKLTVRGLAEKYSAEIKDGVDLTLSMVDAYAAELATEKATIAKLVDEKPDPDSGPVVCESPVHRGDSEPFQPVVRFRLTRSESGDLVRMRHPQGGVFIEVGNFLVVPADAETSTADSKVPYCASCREVAWSLGRESQVKVTFYTASGAQRKLDAMKRASEGHEALAAQLKSAGARSVGYGSRKIQDWRRLRGAKK